MRGPQLEYADTKAERVMLRAEVAMLQLTVAEAIGMGPRGREYGLIRAAAATSDDEGAGAAPLRRRSLVWGTHGSIFIYVHRAGCYASGGQPRLRYPTLSPGCRNVHTAM